MEPVRRPVNRQGARVLLLDEQGRVLLLHGKDSTLPESVSWWFTPGGGLEPGESAEEAAIREVFEESGLRLTEVAGPIHEQTIDLTFEGVPLHQSEQFFVARVPRFTVTGAGRTELEKRTLSDSRWWSADELETTTETIYPECLGSLVRQAAKDT